MIKGPCVVLLLLPCTEPVLQGTLLLQKTSDEQVALALAVVAVFKDFRTILQYDIFEKLCRIVGPVAEASLDCF